MPGAGKEGKRADASAVAAQEKRKTESLRTMSGSSYANPRWQYMLSYLNRAQMAQWNKYSSIQQRKIMEEIEKKLERKLPGDEVIPPESRSYSFFDVDAYAQEEKSSSEYRIRGHPKESALRVVQEETLRQERMAFRVNRARSMLRSDTGHTDRMGKNPSRACSISAAGSVIKGGNTGAKTSLKTARGPMLQRRPGRQEILNEKESRSSGLIMSDEGPVTNGGKRLRSDPTSETRGRDITRRNAAALRAGKEQRKKGSSKPFDETSSGSGASFTASRALSSRAGRERARERLTGSRSREKESELPILRQRAEGEDALPERKPAFPGRDLDGEVRYIDDAIRKEGDLIRLKGERGIQADPKSKGPAEKSPPALEDGKAEMQLAVMAGAAKPFVEKQAQGFLLPAASGEKRSVTLPERATEKETFIAFKEQMAKKMERSSGQGKRRSRQREKKREAKYRQEFASLLIATIEKDIQKQANISRAQKTGQINASVAELTGETGRGAFRTAAIPLRLHLAFIGKKLREELKRRMKEAIKNLMRHAATFGAPVFAVVIIVMLLSAICMIGTTQNEPRGTGLGFKIVQEAKKHLGLPYVYGGTSLVSGCDCSGFVWAIYNIFGYNLPRTAGDQYAYGRKVGSDVSDWQLGDLIYYSRTGGVQSGGGRGEHIVIYIGGGQVISCGPVAIYNWDYRSDYYGTCRIIPDEPLGGDFSGSTNEEVCWNYFISQGFSEAATAGILGNMYVESGGTFDPSIHQYGGGPGRGLCQWEESYSGGSGRYNNLVAFAEGLGKSWDDITAQLQFVCYELDSGAMNPYFSKFGGVEAFKNSTDPTTATYVFLCGFEYCGDPGESFLESAFSLSIRVDHAGWAYLNYQ